MKNSQKLFVTVMVGLLIVPQITFAAWWNPLSWGIFSSFFHNNTQTIEVTSIASSTNQISATSTNDSATEVAPVVPTPPAIKPSIKLAPMVSVPIVVPPPPVSTQTSVPTLPKSDNQICSDTYGVNSSYTGQRGTNGGPICGCNTGYQWNSGQTSCVAVPAKTGYQICSEQYGNATWDGTSYTSSGGFNCTCNQGYVSMANSTGGSSCQLPGTPYKAQDGNCYYPNAYDSNGKPLQASCPIQTQTSQPVSVADNSACQTATQNMEKFQNSYAYGESGLSNSGVVANIAQAQAAIFANQYNTELPAYQTAAQAACSVPLPIPTACQTALQDFNTFQAQYPLSQLVWMGVQGNNFALRFPAKQTAIQYACQ